MASIPPTLSRTIAILLPHAAKHRPDVVKRFREAGFEIRDEFDWDADPVVVEMDLGITEEGLKRAFVGEGEEEGTGGAEGDGEERRAPPCHVWCLERRRVVEVMAALVVSLFDPLCLNWDELRAEFGVCLVENREAKTSNTRRRTRRRRTSLSPSFLPPFSFQLAELYYSLCSSLFR